MTTDKVRELANRICYSVTRRRLRRAGMWDEYRNADPQPVDNMKTEEEQQPWLDVAEVVGDMIFIGEPIEKLRALTNDWIRYRASLQSSRPWSNQMCRAVVVEMRMEIEKLWGQCQDQPPVNTESTGAK